MLGVAPDASVAEIRRAYLALARRHHPDFHVGATAAARAETERVMQQLNEAWLVLGDRRRRADYDLDRAARPEPGGGRWAAGMAHPDFVPYDEGDDGGAGPAPDGPGEGGSGHRVPRWQQLLPAACLLAGLAVLALGVVLGGRPLLALGVALVVAAGAGFVLTPMLAVLRTYEREPGR